MSDEQTAIAPALPAAYALQLVATVLGFMADSASAMSEGRPVYVEPSQTEASALARLADLPALLGEVVPDEQCRAELERIVFNLAATVRSQSTELERLRSRAAPLDDSAARFVADLADRLESDGAWRDGDTLSAVLGVAREGVPMNDEREAWCRLLALAQRFIDRLNARPRRDMSHDATE